MRIAICDDEIDVANIISKSIINISHKLMTKPNIDIYNNGYELLDIYHSQYDVLFLDICLPGINGYELAKKIRQTDETVLIVFLTSVSDYVYDAYKINAYRYILKENFSKEIYNLLVSIEKNIKKEHNYILTINKHGCKKILCDDILYITSNLRKIIIFTNKESYSTYGKLSDFEKNLSQYNFIQTHQSFLVNAKYIKTLTSENIILDNNITIPISKARTSQIKKKVMECIKCL